MDLRKGFEMFEGLASRLERNRLLDELYGEPDAREMLGMGDGANVPALEPGASPEPGEMVPAPEGDAA